MLDTARVLLISANEDDVAWLRTSLSGTDAHSVTVDWSMDLISVVEAIDPLQSALLVFVCPEGDPEFNLSILKDLAIVRPELAILLVTESSDPEFVLEARLSGAFDCVNRAQVTAAVLRSLMRQVSATRNIKYVAPDLTDMEVSEHASGWTMQLLRAMLDSLPFQTAIVDQSGRLLAASSAWADCLPRAVAGAHTNGNADNDARSDARPNVPSICTAGDHEPVFFEAIERVLSGAQESSVEYLCHIDGKDIRMQFDCNRMQVGSEQVVVCMRKHSDYAAAAALSEGASSGRPTHQVDALMTIGMALDSYLALDGAGSIIEVNVALCELLGHSRSELVRLKLSDLVNFDEVEALAHQLDLIRADGVGRFETRCRHSDGYLLDVEVSAVCDANGGLRALLRDITERRRSEQALKEGEERYRIVAETATDVIITMDQSGQIRFANQATEKVFGHTADDLVGRSVTMLFPLNTRNEFALSLSHYLQTGQQHMSWEAIELAGLHKDGHEIPLEISLGQSIKDGEQFFTGIIRDITERKVSEAMLHESEEQLRQSQKIEAIGKLAGGVAHDFNNLLAVIMLHTDLLLSQQSADSPQRYRIEEIRTATERAASLTRQLLAFSRKQVLQPKVINMNGVVDETYRMLERLIGEDIELQTRLDPELGLVLADPDQMTQVILNLAVNARDAMREGGRVTIATSNVNVAEGGGQDPGLASGEYVLLTVSDNGSGMTPEVQARIFEPFFTTKEQGKGTGLGLSTVYGIVKQSGGYVWFSSQQGRGTSFHIYLPRVVERPVVEEATLAATFTPGWETILLVEDEPLVRAATSQVLGLNGYHLLIAEDGLEALRLVQDFHDTIHLLLTDVVMPRINGKALADRLVLLRPDIKVLFMSGYTDEDIVHHGVLDAGTNFIEKPFSPLALARKVRTVLDS